MPSLPFQPVWLALRWMAAPAHGMSKRTILPVFAGLAFASFAVPSGVADEVPAHVCTGMNCLPDQTKPADLCKGVDCNPPTPKEAEQCSGLDCQPIPDQITPEPEVQKVAPAPDEQKAEPASR